MIIRRPFIPPVLAQNLPMPVISARPWMGLALGLVWFAPSIAAAAEPLVSITGGADVSGRKYAWTVTNHHNSPIVYIKFPHYLADTFIVPDGWDTETTYLVNVGVPAKVGVCIAKTKPPNSGIARGRSAEFGMRIASEQISRGKGTVTVRFADGTETTIAGVKLPRRPGAIERFAPIIGMGLVVAVWAIFRAIRRRRSATA